MKPAMMALVVAMAGTMLPAISLTSQRDLRGMSKTAERRLDAAVTKSSASASSLSNESAPTSAERCVSTVSIVCSSTAALCSTDHTLVSSCLADSASGSAIASSLSGVGGVRSFHSASIESSRSTSAAYTLLKTRRANEAALSPSRRVSADGADAGAASPGASAAALASTASSCLSCASVVSTRSVSSPPKIFLKSSSLAQAMQWTGLSG
mmetsp:Transcript_2684/g.5700  ORF Transcript_2684/g.5700 Transcript_2684/m.5700 type:complete len:210 (-) Transcript_2684:705-1334(-)